MVADTRAPFETLFYADHFRRTGQRNGLRRVQCIVRACLQMTLMKESLGFTRNTPQAARQPSRQPSSLGDEVTRATQATATEIAVRYVGLRSGCRDVS